MSKSTSILLVDDHTLFRESLGRMLESEPGFTIVGHCVSASEAIRAIERSDVDVVLLDYDLGPETGIGFLRELRLQQKQARVLMVTAGMSSNVTSEAIQAGVAGILFKHSDPGQLVEAIREVASGGLWLDRNGVSYAPAAAKESGSEDHRIRPLTARQQQVLFGILDGLTNKEIAWKLKVSESSVKAVIQELFSKTGVRTRSQLVRITIERHSEDWLKSEDRRV